MLNFLKRLFQEKPPTPTGRVINAWDHQGWGDSILWLDFEKRKMYGWQSDRLKVGDEIRVKLTNGQIGRFIIKTVAYENDPHDMFFAVVDYLGLLNQDV